MAKATARMTTSGPPFPLNELTTAPWREQALTKIGEQRFVLEWMAQADGAQPISSGSLRPHTSSARFRRSLKGQEVPAGRRHAPRATPTARGGLTAHCASAPPDRPSARRRTTAIPGAGIERGAAGQPTTISRARVDAAMRSAASGWDIAVVLGVGLLAAALAAAASLRWIHGTSTPSAFRSPWRCASSRPAR